MDWALQGHRGWRLILLAGSARPRLAGAGAPAEASWVALTGLSPACRRDGVPGHVISDSGGAFIADAFEGVWTRLGLDHKTMVRPEGQSDQNLMKTPCNIQRRVDDSQLALTRTPSACEEAPQRFLDRSTTTAHQGRLQEPCASPRPLHVLGERKGRLSPPQELDRPCAHALLVRTTKRYGCVPLHRSHFDVDQGVPQTPVRRWVAGQDLRAVCDQVLVADYPCHDDLRAGTVTNLRLGQWSPSPCAARQAQGARRARPPQDSVVVYRPPSVRRQAPFPLRAEP